MRINVSAFGNRLPNKIAISNTAPPKVKTLQSIIEELGPGHELFELLIPGKDIWLDYKKRAITWKQFEVAYQAQIEFLNLRKMMRVLCNHLGAEEITLCCWESSDDEHCHRKILFDNFHDSYMGVRK
jgi:uncharacterized protein YeaO (DUF488 family)